MLEFPFHDWSELEERATDLFEEIVELQRMVHVKIVDHSQGVPFHAMSFQEIDSPDDLIKRAFSGTGVSIFIVKFPGAVDRDSNEPIVFSEESAPFVVKEDSIGLNGVVDSASGGIFLLQFENSLIKSERTQERLPTVPAEEDLGHCLGLDIFFHKLFEVGVRHREGIEFGLPVFWIEVFLFQVVAVFTVHVAERTCGFCHHIKGTGKGETDFCHLPYFFRALVFFAGAASCFSINSLTCSRVNEAGSVVLGIL